MIIAEDSSNVPKYLLTDSSGYLKVILSDATEDVSVTTDGYLDVKTHSSDECFMADYAGAQTDTEIITPTAGKKIQIQSVYVSTDVNDVDVTLKFGTSGNIFFKLYTSKKQAQAGNVVCAVGATNEKIELTCGAGTFVSIAYDEID